MQKVPEELRQHLPPTARGPIDMGDDPDARLVVEVDARGHPRWRGEIISMPGLERVLSSKAAQYDLRLRAWDESGYVDGNGIRWSRLYVLIWGDRRAPWSAVHLLLRTLRRQGYYRVQFAGVCTTGSTPGRTKIQAPLWREKEKAATTVDITIRRTGRGVLYQLGKHPPGTARDLGERVCTSAQGRIRARIRAPATVAFEHVVALVDQLQGARITGYTFEVRGD